jgi:hypothetical protein
VLSGVVLGPDKVTVDWTLSTGATAYTLYYSTTPGAGPQNGTAVQNPARPFTLTGLTTDDLVYFKVVATNAPAAMASNELPTRRLAVAERPMIRIGASGKLTFQWTAVPGATAYRLRYNLSSGFNLAGPHTQVPGVTSGHVATIARSTDSYFGVTAEWNGITGELGTLQVVRPSSTYPDEFADAAFDGCVLTSPTTTTSLSCYGGYGSVRSIEGIDVFPGLTELMLNACELRDVSPLFGMTALNRLHMPSCTLDDAKLSALPPLPKLADLNVNGNPSVTKVPVISSPAMMLTLNLNGTNVSDLTSLTAMTGLQTLDIARTQVTNVTPIKGLASLTNLIANGLKFNDVSTFASMTGLRYLDLRNNDVQTGVLSLTALTNASIILNGNPNMPCADAYALRTALGVNSSGAYRVVYDVCK